MTKRNRLSGPRCRLNGRLAEIRKSMGLTQVQVANAAGLPETTYLNYESGLRRAKVETIGKISSFLGIDPSEIMSAHDSGESLESSRSKFTQYGWSK